MRVVPSSIRKPPLIPGASAVRCSKMLLFQEGFPKVPLLSSYLRLAAFPSRKVKRKKNRIINVST